MEYEIDYATTFWNWARLTADKIGLPHSLIMLDNAICEMCGVLYEDFIISLMDEDEEEEDDYIYED